jgi:phosphoglycolate phosphatase-like HAD superfamily hydrolase
LTTTNEFQRLKQQWHTDLHDFGLDMNPEVDNGKLHPLGNVDIEKSKFVITDSVNRIRNLLQQHQQKEKQIQGITNTQQQKEELDQYRQYCKLWKDHKKTTLQKEHIAAIISESTQKLADYITHQQSDHTQEVSLKSSQMIKNEKLLKALEEIRNRMKHFKDVMTFARPDSTNMVDDFCDLLEDLQESGVKLLYYTIANSKNTLDVICNSVGSVQSVKLTQLPDTTDEVFNMELTKLLQTSQYEKFIDVLVMRFQALTYYKDYGAVIGEGNVLELRPPVCVSWEIAREIWKYCSPMGQQSTQTEAIAEGIDLQHLLLHNTSSYKYSGHIYTFHSSDTNQNEMKKYHVIRGIQVSKIPFPQGTKIDPIFKLLRQQLIFNDLFHSCFASGIEAITPTYNIEVTCIPPSVLLLRTMLPQLVILTIEIVIKDGEAQVKMEGDKGQYATRVLRETSSIPIMMHFILHEWPKMIGEK